MFTDSYCQELYERFVDSECEGDIIKVCIRPKEDFEKGEYTFILNNKSHLSYDGILQSDIVLIDCGSEFVIYKSRYGTYNITVDSKQMCTLLELIDATTMHRVEYIG